jgi:preprotein translocase subunit SecD
MDELSRQLPGRLERLSERLTGAAQPVDPEALRRRGRRWRRRRLASGAVAAAALLVGAVLIVGWAADLLPVPSTGVAAQPATRSVVLTATAPDGGQAAEAKVKAAAQIVRERLQAAGVEEPSVQARGSRMLVKVPESRWRDDLPALLTAPGRLELRAVRAGAIATDSRRPFSTVACTADPPLPAPDRQAVLCVRPEGADNAAHADIKLLLGPAAAGNDEAGSAYPEDTMSAPGDGADWQVVVELTPRGQRALQELTASAACQPVAETTREIALVLDGSVVLHLPVGEDVACGTGISGGSISVQGLTERQARRLAALVTSDPLPVRLRPQPPAP